MSWEHLGLIGQLRQHIVQRSVHLCGGALEEAPAATNKQRVAGEDDLFVGLGVPHVPADAILRMAGCMERCDFDILAELESTVMRRGFGYFGTVLTPNHG